MRYFILIMLLVSLTGCAASGYREFYSSHAEVSTLSDVQSLKKDETPTIYTSDNLERDAKILISKGFVLIGESSFNGSLEGKEQAASQAVRVGALVVVIASTYSNTQTNIVPLLIPNSSTTYGSGSVYGSSGVASYSGSSTTYGTTAIPVVTHQRRFDQSALYFVKSTKKLKYGVSVNDLTPELRASIQRNTGALVYLVMEDSPAFNANILPSDILIQIDGADVRNAEHAAAIMNNAAPPNGESQLTILRNGEKKVIKVQLTGSQ